MFTHYTHFKSSLLAFLCLSVPLASQKKLQTDKTGTLLQSEYVKLKKEKGYDGIGKFDTISLNPLLIYAGTVKDNKLGVIDLYGKEILKNEYKQIRGIYNTWTGLPGYHDHFLLQNEKGWAISDYYGSPKTPFIYDHLWFEEYLPVAKRIQPEKFESRILKILSSRQNRENLLSISIKKANRSNIRKVCISFRELHLLTITPISINCLKSLGKLSLSPIPSLWWPALRIKINSECMICRHQKWLFRRSSAMSIIWKKHSFLSPEPMIIKNTPMI